MRYLVAELMAVVERRRTDELLRGSGGGGGDGGGDRMGNGVKLKEGRRVTRIRTKESAAAAATKPSRSATAAESNA